MGHARVDHIKLERALKRLSEKATRKAAEKFRHHLRGEILTSGRVNTGEMMEKIDIHRQPALGKKVIWRVVPKTKQFKFQDKGTRGATARPGKVLRFMPKGQGVYIFRKKVGPIHAAHFTEKAIKRMRPHDWV